MEAKFRKKAIEVEAIQFTGENGRKVAAWASALSGNCSLHYHDMNTGQTREKATFNLSSMFGNISLVTNDWLVYQPGYGFFAFGNGQFQELFEPADAKPAAPTIKPKIIGDLEWQEEVPEREFTWEQAKEYAASLGDGWRLPTVQELVSLWDYDKGFCPAFPNSKGRFWSSSPHGYDYAWGVVFDYGRVGHGHRSYEHSVRCVRDVKGVE